MGPGKYDLSIGIGGEAGQGIATPGDILARIFVRRGLHLYTYNAYQSINPRWTHLPHGATLRPGKFTLTATGSTCCCVSTRTP